MAKVNVIWTGGGFFESGDGSIKLAHNEPQEIDKKDFTSLTKDGQNPELILAQNAEKEEE